MHTPQKMNKSNRIYFNLRKAPYATFWKDYNWVHASISYLWRQFIWENNLGNYIKMFAIELNKIKPNDISNFVTLLQIGKRCFYTICMFHSKGMV